MRDRPRVGNKHNLHVTHRYRDVFVHTVYAGGQSNQGAFATFAKQGKTFAKVVFARDLIGRIAVAWSRSCKTSKPLKQ